MRVVVIAEEFCVSPPGDGRVQLLLGDVSKAVACSRSREVVAGDASIVVDLQVS